METKYCRKCGTAVSSDTRFCPNCGYEFSLVPATQNDSGQKTKYCRKCGKANSASARFCLYCGYSFDGTQPLSGEAVHNDVSPYPAETAPVSGRTPHKDAG
ncbi:MAG: zinc ribbon domain-containing protein, partial [Oscillospiraceae bacterium]|nr:zinc ribbon domain-containing protein [Oscillospiraceae bacterium]